MADLKREEELAYVLVSIVRDMAARRVEDCIPELAMWIKTVRDEFVSRYERPLSRLDAGPAALVWLERLLSSVTAYSDKALIDAAREWVAQFRPPVDDEERSAPPQPSMECGRCLADGEHVPASECERHFGERHG